MRHCGAVGEDLFRVLNTKFFILFFVIFGFITILEFLINETSGVYGNPNLGRLKGSVEARRWVGGKMGSGNDKTINLHCDVK